MTTATRALTLTDGGLETTLVFDEGLELPAFAAFPLLQDAEGRAALRRYFGPYLEAADALGLPFVLDTPTWRANPAWGPQLGFDDDALAAVNARAVAFARELAGDRPVTVNGVIGPRGDGYVVGERMGAEAAEAHHAHQVGWLRDAGADRVTALTLSYAAEAVGVVRAAVAHEVPVVVSFTVEVDGRLPDGTTLGEAIAHVDEATGGAALAFGVNCAHPTHIAAGLDGHPALARIGLLRVNGSPLSHAELDEAEALDADDPADLAAAHVALHAALPGVRTVGGCCGTGHRHVEAIAAAWPGA